MDDVFISEEEAEARRAMQPGRINTPERKEARIRARLAAEEAARRARLVNAPDYEYSAGGELSFPLAENHAMAKAAGLKLPGNWLSRLMVRFWRWLRA